MEHKGPRNWETFWQQLFAHTWWLQNNVLLVPDVGALVLRQVWSLNVEKKWSRKESDV